MPITAYESHRGAIGRQESQRNKHPMNNETKWKLKNLLETTISTAEIELICQLVEQSLEKNLNKSLGVNQPTTKNWDYGNAAKSNQPSKEIAVGDIVDYVTTQGSGSGLGVVTGTDSQYIYITNKYNSQEKVYVSRNFVTLRADRPKKPITNSIVSSIYPEYNQPDKSFIKEQEDIDFEKTAASMPKRGSITSAHEPVDYGNYNLWGLGPEARVVSTKQGGLQSHTPYAFHAFPPLATARCAKVLAEGLEKYSLNNWINIPNPLHHVGKGIGHCFAFLAGDLQESADPSEHLAHAICRLLFALDLIERKKQDDNILCP